MQRIHSVLLVLLILCSTASCSKLASTEKSSLTGMVLDKPSNPTVMVMINNQRHARPQTGLNLADVVVEILAEGEITRFAAFYQSHMSGTVGPVRSVRDYFYQLAKGDNAVLVHAGGPTDALVKIQNDDYPHLDGIHKASKYFTRVDFRKPPHNLYTTLEQIQEGIQNSGFKTKSLGKYIFSDDSAAIKGKVANNIHLVYHRLYDAGYRYDSSNGHYIRYTQGEKQVDRETNKPLAMQNLLVVFAEHNIEDAVGHRRVDIIGSGKGFLCQKGRVIPIDWRYRLGLIVPFIDGKEVALLPGKTWVNVLPTTGKVTFE